MDGNHVRRWNDTEISVGKSTLREYSNYGGPFHNFNLRGQYWNMSMWNEVVQRYNELGTQVPQQIRVLAVNDFLCMCKEIQRQYCSHRATNGGYGYTDMEDVFSPCETCQLRIPIFPNKFANRSTISGSNSNSYSYSGQRRSHSEAFGYSNIPTNHYSGGFQIGHDRTELLYKTLREMRDNGYITPMQYRLLLSEKDLLEAFWPHHILDHNISLQDRARDVLEQFCDGASTSRQH